ncbi:MAG TPA: TlpA disulfide reductase family protein [Candidatus Eisenbacteria bacterium]|nr:TlpA disulfide reductase family protein [Candidatus Eisenbacteria bacterium]
MTTIDAGQTAPQFRLKSLDGKTYSLATLLEKGPVVAAFFKVSCPVCQFTLPFIQRLADRYSGDNATILAISQDDSKHTAAFNKEYNLKLLTLLDDPEDYRASNAYGLSMVPTIILIEADGKVRVSCMGFGKADLETIAAELSMRRKIAAAPLFRTDEVIPATKPG